MPRIVMPPEEVRQAGAKFAEQAQVTITAVAALRNALGSVDWEGLTQQAFFQRYEQAQKLMNEYTELLNSINKELGEIATRFESADRSGTGSA